MDKPLTLKQIFELTHEELVADIAKNYLPIGEKPTRAILKFAGGVQNVGKKGWNYDNVIETDLSLTVSDFKTKANPTNKNELIVTRINPSASDSQGNNTSASTNTTSTDNSEATKTTTASKPKSTNRTTRKPKISNRITSTNKAEIEALMNNITASTNDRRYKGIYFDDDIADFLDTIKSGNRSELVNKIIRQYLVENGYWK